MAKIVRGGRLVDAYLPPAKKRKGKDMAWPISSQYDMAKDVSLERPKGWHEHYDVPDNKKAKVYREYVASPGKSKWRGQLVGTKDESTRWWGKTTTITLNSKKKKMLDKRAK